MGIEALVHHLKPPILTPFLHLDYKRRLYSKCSCRNFTTLHHGILNNNASMALLAFDVITFAYTFRCAKLIPYVMPYSLNWELRITATYSKMFIVIISPYYFSYLVFMTFGIQCNFRLSFSHISSNCSFSLDIYQQKLWDVMYKKLENLIMIS